MFHKKSRNQAVRQKEKKWDMTRIIRLNKTDEKKCQQGKKLNELGENICEEEETKKWDDKDKIIWDNKEKKWDMTRN